MAMIPMAVYGLKVPAGDVAIPARLGIPSAFKITMAAIDPSAEPLWDGTAEGPAHIRSILRIMRQPIDDDLDSDDEDFDADQMERMLAEEDSDEDSEDDEERNGGPSDPAKSKKAKRAAAEKEIQKLLEEEGMMVDDEDLPNGINGKKSAKARGKMPASDEDEDEDDDDEDEDEDEDEHLEELVICTLDPSKNIQQALDITIGEDEEVWFTVSGTHTVFLTGNYVEPADTRPNLYGDSDEEDDYDLEPDSDELDDSEDGLDELDDPRITEIDDEDEVPALVQAKAKAGDLKNKNKRRASDNSDGEDTAETIDEMISKAAAANGDAKLSKKQAKKLKKNDGAAAVAPVVDAATTEAQANKADKKVSFAKQLEQGPTGTKAAGKGAVATLGVKTVQGVTIDDKKLGTGQAAKAGDRVSMRYIGKLQKDNKVFDSNKKGKPFSFKLGANEVIKGWEIGIAGMAAGGERRITVPAHLAYGSKSLPGIPSNSVLVFDVKMLDINKAK